MTPRRIKTPHIGNALAHEATRSLNCHSNTTRMQFEGMRGSSISILQQQQHTKLGQSQKRLSRAATLKHAAVPTAVPQKGHQRSATQIPKGKTLFCLPGLFAPANGCPVKTFRHHAHARLGSGSWLGTTITQHLRQGWLGALHSSAVNQGNSSPPINIDMSLARPQRAGSPPAFAAASWRTKPRTSSPMCPSFPPCFHIVFCL